MNYNLLLIRNLYSVASEKYLKFKYRYERALHTGRFHKLSKRKQVSLINRLKRLFNRLKSLQAQLRLAGAGAAFALTLSTVSPLQAQTGIGPFVENASANPFLPPISGNRPMPAPVDIDADGDLDVFVGNYFPNPGNIRFFENIGGPTTLRQFVQNDAGNPFDGVNVGRTATPAFADIDSDGDYDMLLGVYYYGDNYSSTHFFRNTGTPTNPIFVEETGAANPFNTINAGKYGPPHPVFVDIDGDSDIDLFVGSRPNPFSGQPSIRFFQNIGTVLNPVFTLTAHPLSSAANSVYDAAPAFADLDEDGDLDALIGHQGTGSLLCFINNGSTFNQATGIWNPINKTGNPTNNLFFSNRSSPEFADFDGDGDLDLLVGQDSYYQYNSNIVYYENTDGDFTLVVRNNLNISPFGGVDVFQEASPVFSDLDDDCDLDAVLGAKYDTYVRVYKNENGVFVNDPNHQIPTLNLFYDVIPVLADIDNDGDDDLFTSHDFNIFFFRNNAGTFVQETSPLNFGFGAGQIPGDELSLTFMDFDGDNDLDAFVGNNGVSGNPPIIQYLENQGTPGVPNFVLITAPPPFDTRTFDASFIPEDNPNVISVDFDHDGDFDLVVSAAYYPGDESYQTKAFFFENKGDGTFGELLSSPINIRIGDRGYFSFFDLDGDGDLDAFAGRQDGKVDYLENTNPPPAMGVNESVVDVLSGVPTPVDPGLNITDIDNDEISTAIVAISNYIPGDESLTFTPQAGITGSFDLVTGILTFVGKAPISTYQTLLQSLNYTFTGTVPGGRQKPGAGRVQDLSRSITFQVRDADFTAPTTYTVNLNVTAPNAPPAIVPQPIMVNEGASVTMNILPLITDPDGNFNPSPTSLTIVQQPTSGAIASLNFVSATVVELTINYTGLNFSGTDQLQVEACDDLGACTTSNLSVQVAPNNPPAIAAQTVTSSGTTVTLNVLPLITDADGNFTPSLSTITIVQQPISGAVASLVFVSASVINLEVDYSGITFTGLDQLQLEACDDLGACTINTITIQVDVAAEIVIYNAISPNTDDNLNSFFKIQYIETVSPDNKVTIYNRWGDVVFAVTDYNNTTRKFEGLSDNGKELPTGTYFYKIEITGQTLTGYLSLKR